MARPVFVFLVIAYLHGIPGSGTEFSAHAWGQEPGPAAATTASSSTNTASDGMPGPTSPPGPSIRGVEGEPSANQTSDGAEAATENEKSSSTLRRNSAPSKSFFEDFFSNPLNFALLLVVFVYIALMFLGPRNLRKEQQAHVERLKNLKKNDRVITSAGIHGIVANINSEADTISLRVDENTNTKITVDKASIRSIVSQS